MRLSDVYRLVREGKALPKKEEPKYNPHKTLKQVYSEMVSIKANLSNGEEINWKDIQDDDFNKEIRPTIDNLTARSVLDIVLSDKGWTNPIQREQYVRELEKTFGPRIKDYYDKDSAKLPLPIELLSPQNVESEVPLTKIFEGIPFKDLLTFILSLRSYLI